MGKLIPHPPYDFSVILPSSAPKSSDSRYESELDSAAVFNGEDVNMDGGNSYALGIRIDIEIIAVKFPQKRP